MPIEVVLPALSAGMEDALIVRWLKRQGDTVTSGELLAEVETDKATMEVEARTDGTLGRILVGDGERAIVNQVIALMLKSGESASALEATRPDNPLLAMPVAAAPVSEASKRERARSGTGTARPFASPLARRLAAERDIALETLSGSGPKGRIVRIDVLRAGQQGGKSDAVFQPADSADAPLPAGIGAHDKIAHNAMRQTIARRLTEAKQTIPHFYLGTDVQVDALLDLRAKINADRKDDERISVNDFIIKAAAFALSTVPEANVIWTQDAILRLHDIDIAVAVAIGDGLMTPVIRQAAGKGLGAVSSEMKALAARARAQHLKPEEYQGGSLSISNLGMYGVKSFAAIINPPQSAILAVGKAERQPVIREEQLSIATLVSLTLSIDHRSIDGALGGQLLAAMKHGIENPLVLLV